MACAAIAEAGPQETTIRAPASQEIENQGLDSFYSLEYDRAIELFQKLRESEPGNAAFSNHLAAAYFYKQLLVAGVLQGDLFSSSNKFFRRKKIEPDPALANNFWGANNAAISSCEQRLRKNRKDQTALYDCGVAYAGRSAYLGLVERSKLPALRSALKASDYHGDLARLDPGCYDAYLVPGIFEYVAGSLPGSFKFLLYFAGVSGDKERGIQRVESTAKWGTRSREDARIMLTVIYRREKRYAEARRNVEELVQLFPRNYIYPLELASLHHGAGEDKEAIAAYKQVLEDVGRGRPGFAAAPLARIHFELGQLYLKAGELESAKVHLAQVPGSAGSNPELEIEDAALRQTVEEALRVKHATTPAAALP